MPQISTKPYILVLPSWYPSEAHKFNGDFNQRLVEAVSLKVPQIVLYIVGKSDISNTYFTLTKEKNIKTYLVYYPEAKNYLGRFLSKLHYLFLQFKFLKLIFKENGLPQLTHVYVFWMAGIAALAIKKIYGIPYLITEHWTAFYKDSPPDLYKRNFLLRFIFKIIFNNATHFITVAEKLKGRILEWNSKARITVIPNVVDTTKFNYHPKINENKKFRLVHVSTMRIQKNIIGLLDGYERAILNNPNLELILVGEVPDNVKTKINLSSILKNNIECTGEVEYSTVKDIMNKSDVLIMFSRFENLPCVILEALCCGLPVITTNVGGCAEVIDQTNGLLINNENVNELVKAIEYMISNKITYKSELISQNAIRNFSYNAVAAKVKGVYENMV